MITRRLQPGRRCRLLDAARDARSNPPLPPPLVRTPVLRAYALGASWSRRTTERHVHEVVGERQPLSASSDLTRGRYASSAASRSSVRTNRMFGRDTCACSCSAAARQRTATATRSCHDSRQAPVHVADHTCRWTRPRHTDATIPPRWLSCNACTTLLASVATNRELRSSRFLRPPSATSNEMACDRFPARRPPDRFQRRHARYPVPFSDSRRRNAGLALSSPATARDQCRQRHRGAADRCRSEFSLGDRGLDIFRPGYPLSTPSTARPERPDSRRRRPSHRQVNQLSHMLHRAATAIGLELEDQKARPGHVSDIVYSSLTAARAPRTSSIH